MLKIERSIFINAAGALEEKDTKTHQHRRIILGPEDDAVLDEQEAAARRRASKAGISFDPNGHIYSPVPDGSLPHHPDTVSKRYARLARRLGIRSSLKNHRHYNATELINAGYNVRTAAGRLGHSGGGTTTLRVYTAWWSEADQRAAGATPIRLPRPIAATNDDTLSTPDIRVPNSSDEALKPYERIAADLRGAIDSGILSPGDPLPTEKTLAERYGVASSTAHRAVALLVAAGIASASRGRRATVAGSDTGPLASVTRSGKPSRIDGARTAAVELRPLVAVRNPRVGPGSWRPPAADRLARQSHGHRFTSPAADVRVPHGNRLFGCCLSWLICLEIAVFH